MAAYQLIAGSTDVIRTADGATIPDDPDNSDRIAYAAWLAEPNTPDPAPSETLSAARLRTKALVDAEATAELQAWLAGTANNGLIALVESSRLAEARRLPLDGSATDAEFPMLKGMVDEGLATDLADAATLVAADFDAASLAVNLGRVGAVRRKAHEDIDAAVSGAAAEAVVAAITWPS